MRYRLIQDGSCHWYVCPEDKADEARRIFDEIEDYWERGEYDKEPPEEPEYVIAVGGSPSRVTFTDPNIS